MRGRQQSVTRPSRRSRIPPDLGKNNRRISPEFPKKISAGRGERRCAPGPPRPIWEPIFQGVARGVIGCQGGGSEAAALAREAGASARSTPRRMTENATNCYGNGSYLGISRGFLRVLPINTAPGYREGYPIPRFAGRRPRHCNRSCRQICRQVLLQTTPNQSPALPSCSPVLSQCGSI